MIWNKRGIPSYARYDRLLAKSLALLFLIHPHKPKLTRLVQGSGW